MAGSRRVFAATGWNDRESNPFVNGLYPEASISDLRLHETGTIADGSESMACGWFCPMAEAALHEMVGCRLGLPAPRARFNIAARTRLRAYQNQNAGLAALYGGIAVEPIPHRLTALIAEASAAAALDG